MTTQTKIFIELADIIGLRLQCNTCKCSLAMETEDETGTVNNLLAGNNTVLLKCPTCGANWTEPASRQAVADTSLKELFRKLQDVKRAERGFGCSITLEIAQPQEA